MKKFSLFLILLFTFIASQAQWQSLVSPTFNELRGVWFTNPVTGYVSGGLGTMMKTTDGGQTWTFQTTNFGGTLRAVQFVDDQTGFTVGEFGTILKTTNGGTTWTPLTSGTSNLLRSVCFVTPDIGWAAGGFGTIIKTTNGGTTWTAQSSGTGNDLIQIRFLDENNGYAVSSLGTFLTGLILKTTDGGATWTTVYNDANGLLGLAIEDINNIYAGGYLGTMVKSDNAGSTWSYVTTNAFNIIRAGQSTGPGEVYMCGDGGDMLYTNDGGATWTNQSIQFTGLLGIHFPIPEVGYSVGAGGVMIRYVSPLQALVLGNVNGPAAICEGGMAAFSLDPVSNATGISWTVPAGWTITNGQGTYQIDVVTNGTSGTVTANVTGFWGLTASASTSVTANPNPATPDISFDGTNLVSTATSGNQWYFNLNPIAGATGQTYLPVDFGPYNVQVTDGNGCVANSSVFIYSPVGISEAVAELISLYPNPAGSECQLTFPVALSGTITLRDASGRIVQLNQLNNNSSLLLNVSELAAGMYTLHLANESGIEISTNQLIVK